MENVEDIYRLSPLQESLLGHALAGNGDTGLEQTTFVFEGDVDVAAFERTWRTVVARHPTLRTAFVHEGLPEPLQVVRQRVEVPFELHDWRHLDEGEREAAIPRFLEEDRRRGFHLARAPLVRASLVRLDERKHLFLWSHHHLILDGWCRTLLLREVMACYHAFSHGQDMALPPSRPFRAYIEWLQRQDRAPAEAFWRDLLEGVEAPTPLVVDRLPKPPPAAGAGRYGEWRRRLDQAAVERLEGFARRVRVTPGTLVQAAWGLLLGRYSGRREVVFGTAVSGRPPDLPQVTSILGMFINNLPVRLDVAPDARVGPWLQAFQKLLLQVRDFGYLSPRRVQELGGYGPATRLFESLVVFQNYPVGASAATAGRGEEEPAPDPAPGAPGLSFELHHVRIETSFPLTLVVVPRETWTLRLLYDRRRVAATAAGRMLGHLARLLHGLAGGEDRRVDELDLLAPAERHQLVVEPQDARRPPVAEEELRRWLERGGVGNGAGSEAAADDLRLSVLDSRRAPCPLGVPGQVHLGGTAPGEGLVATGELARWLPMAGIERLGPVDGSEPWRETEAVLRRHPGVRRAAVRPWTGADGDERLVAYVVPEEDRPPGPAELRTFAREALPEPLVPSAFTVLDALPATGDGGLDRAALPPPEALGDALQEALEPPGTPLELRLLQIWEELFEVRPLGVTDDFFGLGGHSLLALALARRVRTELGTDLPLSELLRSPTVRGLADRISAGAGGGGESSLVPIRASGSALPVFAVHPAGGGAFCYVELAHKLGRERPFFGLQAPGWQDGREPVEGVEELAKLYLGELREARPRGPYHLLGWSFGAFVAFEMARSLAEAGERVPLLVILDAAIVHEELAEQDDAEFLRSVLGGDALLSEEELRDLGSFDRQMSRLAELAREAGRIPDGFDVESARRLLEIWKMNRRAGRAYVPRRYPGRVALLRSAETVERGPEDPTLGWGAVAEGGVEIDDVPGTHRELVTAPWVTAVAERIADWLRRVEGGE